jgi:hypothetical protein
MDLSNVPFFQRPMSASKTDKPTGNMDEAGNVEYISKTGQTYFIKPSADQRTTRTKIEEDVVPALKDFAANPSLPSADQMKQFGMDAVQGTYEGIKGAVEGTGTMGDVFGVAPAMGIASAPFEVPEGAVRSFGGKSKNVVPRFKMRGETTNFPNPTFGNKKLRDIFEEDQWENNLDLEIWDPEVGNFVNSDPLFVNPDNGDTFGIGPEFNLGYAPNLRVHDLADIALGRKTPEEALDYIGMDPEPNLVRYVNQRLSNLQERPEFQEYLERYRGLNEEYDPYDALQTNPRTGNEVATFRSPIPEVLSNLDFPKNGIKGSQLLKEFQDSPSIRGSELKSLGVDINPQQRYSKEEVDSLFEGKLWNASAYIVENPMYSAYQRQQVLDPTVDYFELIVNADKQGGENFRAISQHFENNTLSHARASVKADTWTGQDYILLEELQSDLLQKGFETGSSKKEAQRPPIQKTEEGVRLAFDGLLAEAANRGINRIVIPPFERIVAERFTPGSSDYFKALEPTSGFYATYKKAIDKILKEYEQEFGRGNFSTRLVDIDYVPVAYVDKRDPDNRKTIDLPVTGTEVFFKGAIDKGYDFTKPRFAEGGLVQNYNQGGSVSMDEQMKLFQEGGIADDGMKRDPVSGNEVPPGSLASEVRDDVDAKLSEGEYVVPADVVRFFGVDYFEKLRKKAKEGLAQMDADGRIGGEPVPEEPEDDLPFSDDELMAMDEPEAEAPVGMAEGGSVKSTFNPANYAAGFSANATGGGSASVTGVENKTYINKDGAQRVIMFVNGQPIQQIPAGFVEATPENKVELTKQQVSGNIPAGEVVTETSEGPDNVDAGRGFNATTGTTEDSVGTPMSTAGTMAALGAQPGKSFSNAVTDAITNLDGKDIGKAAVRGALTGGIPGVVSSIVGTIGRNTIKGMQDKGPEMAEAGDTFGKGETGTGGRSGGAEEFGGPGDGGVGFGGAEGGPSESAGVGSGGVGPGGMGLWNKGGYVKRPASKKVSTKPENKGLVKRKSKK